MQTAERSEPAAATLRLSREDILQRLQGPSVAVMLYGSQARGDARADSDVDVLQVVEHGARSYSVGKLNVSAYTAEHLHELSSRGSLFVRHLRSDGIILSDPKQVLAHVLSGYREPTSYLALRRELAVVTSALGLPGVERYPRGSIRAASFAVRSLAYAACAEAGISEFDVLRASELIGRRQVGVDLRSQDPLLGDLLGHADWLLSRADTSAMTNLGCDFEEAVVWVGAKYPAAGALLEAVLADEAEIDYTSLTLPVS